MMRLPPDIKIRLVEFEARPNSLMIFTVDSTAATIILCRIILCVSLPLLTNTCTYINST